MSKNLEIKKQIVEDVSKELSSLANGELNDISTVIFNYSKFGVNEINTLRSKLSESQAKLKVVKNSLIKRIFEQLGVKLQSNLEGQNAILMGNPNNFVDILKSIFSYMKELNKGSITIGLLNGKFISSDQVQALSKLPSRDVLIGQVLSGFIYPLRGLVMTLNGTQVKFVRVINEIKLKKEGVTA